MNLIFVHYQITRRKGYFAELSHKILKERNPLDMETKSFNSFPKFQQVMKFSTILTSAFFALFIFTATTPTFANQSDITDCKISLDKEDHHNIAVISGRMAEVTDTEASTSRNSGYNMTVKVMKGTIIYAEAQANQGSLTLDLAHLPAGVYIFKVTTPNGISTQFVTLD